MLCVFICHVVKKRPLEFTFIWSRTLVVILFLFVSIIIKKYIARSLKEYFKERSCYLLCLLFLLLFIYYFSNAHYKVFFYSKKEIERMFVSMYIICFGILPVGTNPFFFLICFEGLFNGYSFISD